MHMLVIAIQLMISYDFLYKIMYPDSKADINFDEAKLH